MRTPRTRVTLELSEREINLLKQAADHSGTSPAEYARYATLRMAQHDVELSASQQSSDAPAEPRISSRRSLRPTIHRASSPTIEIVRQLEKHLGLQLLAITVGTPPDEVARWGTEESQPSPVHERRLQEAHEVWQLVMSVESIETTRAWWMGMKEQLGDLSPAEAIADDQAAAVMSIARDFVEGG